MKNFLFKLFITFCLLLFICLPVLTKAETSGTTSASDDILPSPVTGPDGGPATIDQVIANAAKLTLGLVGVVALIMFIIGGITWMTSGGNAEQVKKGKGTLIWAAIGLIVCFLAYSLVTFFITKFIGVAGNGGQQTINPDAVCNNLGGSCLDNCAERCVGPGMQCVSGCNSVGVARQCCVSSSQ